MKMKQTPDLTTIHGRLQDAIYKSGLTQLRLAKLAGVSRTYINELCQGKYDNPSADVAIALADALNIPIRWLVRGDPLIGWVRLTRDEETTLTAIRRLSPAQQRKLLSMIETIFDINAPPNPPTATPKTRDKSPHR